MSRSRAELLPKSRHHAPSDWDLRQSLANVGLINPVLYYRGKLIDGSRRMSLCCSLGIQPRRKDIDDRIEAARTLWQLHPSRAYELFAPRRCRLATLCSLFGCSPSEIPSAAQMRDSKRKRASVTKTPGVPIDAGIYKRARQECKKHGTSLSAMLRYYVHTLAGEQPEHPCKGSHSAAAE